MNLVYQVGDPNYCAGCNGSFRLTFTSTSVGTSQGVIGAGFDNLITGTGFYAFVTFGDSTTADFPLNGLAFFRIISPSLIRSIHVGLAGCGATQADVITIDNLSIGGTDCSIAPDGTPCNDGGFCNGEDSCDSGTCSVHAGDPCAGGPDCNQTCNEGSADCLDPPGTGCSTDNNPCTTDTCNGSGACIHAAGNGGVECRAAVDDCDAAETCTGLSSTCPTDMTAPDGTLCTDGTVCTQVDQCSGAPASEARRSTATTATRAHRIRVTRCRDASTISPRAATAAAPRSPCF